MIELLHTCCCSSCDCGYVDVDVKGECTKHQLNSWHSRAIGLSNDVGSLTVSELGNWNGQKEMD